MRATTAGGWPIPKPYGIRQCAWCGHDFEWHPKVRLKFCGRACRNHSKREGQSSPLKWKHCIDCGQPYLGRGQRCGVPCKTWTPADRSERECHECTTLYTPPFQLGPVERYCSDACRRKAARRRHRDAHREGYRERRRNPTMRNSVDVIGKRDRWRCHICGKHVARKDATRDHLVPLSHGGTWEPINLRIAHATCNTARGAGRLPAQLLLVA